MPGRATIASISGLGGGVAATVLITGEGPKSGAGGVALMMAACLAAMVCVVVVAMATMRRWINEHDERTREVPQQVARERSAFIEASAKRAQELREREVRLNQRAEQVSSYVMGIARRLDEALTANVHLERQLAEMTELYEGLAGDYNKIVSETLQERADRFSRRTVSSAVRNAPYAPAPAPQAADTPVRAYADPHSGHHPVAPIPLRRIPSPASAGRLSDDPQHERPVEGVGGSA